MTVDRMRSEIAKVYPGTKWESKVESMSDKQVIAIYHSFLNTGMFKKNRTTREPKAAEYGQISIDDYLKYKEV